MSNLISPDSLDLKHNLGTRPIKAVRNPGFPDAGAAVREQTHTRPEGAVDVLLVNPPSPDGGVWIRTQHRVGRRSREEMVWPQVSLAQLAAMLDGGYRFRIVDAIAERMSWEAFETLVRATMPAIYLTQVTAPTLTNDMRGVMLAKSLGAHTVAFGTHVTPMPLETMRDFPALDFIVRGEPELTFRELVDLLTGREAERPAWVRELLLKTDPRWGGGEGAEGAEGASGVGGVDRTNRTNRTNRTDRTNETDEIDPAQAATVLGGESDRSYGSSSSYPSYPSSTAQPSMAPPAPDRLRHLKGLVWREAGETRINVDRPFIPDLDDLPMPLHHLLPLDQYRMPLMKGPFTFILTSRGCPAGCKYCIKHVTYQWSVRLHGADRVMRELWLLHGLGIKNIHMYADLFTVNRDQVMELCRRIIAEGLKIRWTCNSRVDYVDEEMLRLMGQAGCWLISWGIESGNADILRQAAKGADPAKAARALGWAKAAGIKNWGYFIIGLPGETEASIRQTIDLAKALPLDIALFHVAAPYPGTPFFFEVVKNGWFKPGTRWEEVDMDKGTVLQYDNLSAEDLLYWQRRAFREWALRPGPFITYLKMLVSDPHTFKRALRVGLEHFSWAVRPERRGTTETRYDGGGASRRPALGREQSRNEAETQA